MFDFCPIVLMKNREVDAQENLAETTTEPSEALAIIDSAVSKCEEPECIAEESKSQNPF